MTIATLLVLRLAGQDTALTYKEERLAELPPVDTCQEVFHGFGRDGYHVFIFGRSDGQPFTWYDGRYQPGFEQRGFLMERHPWHIFFIGMTGNQYVPVFDGIEGSKFDMIYSLLPEPAMSLDGKQYACLAVKNGQCFLLRNGIESPSPRPAAGTALVFTPDGSHVLYNGIREGKTCLVVDGAASSEYDEFDSPVLSHDGKHLAYFAARSGAWYVVEDGVRRFELQDDEPPELTISPDGAHLAWQNAAGEAVVDGVVEPGLRRVRGFAISPDGRHTAYLADTEQGMTIVEDGKQWPLFSLPLAPSAQGQLVAADGVGRIASFDTAKPLLFSPDSSHLAYIADEPATNTQRVVFDGVAGPSYALIAAKMVFNPDGQLVYSAEKRTGDKTQFVLVTGGKEAPIEGLAFNLTYSPDGARLFYFMTMQEIPAPFSTRIYTDGKRDPRFDSPWMPVFSPDGKHIAVCELSSSGKKFTWVVDGQPGPESELWGSLNLNPEIEWTAEGAFTYPIVRGNILYLVTAHPGGAAPAK